MMKKVAFLILSLIFCQKNQAQDLFFSKNINLEEFNIYAYDRCVTQDNGMLLAGNFFDLSKVNFNPQLLMKINQFGDFEWSKTLALTTGEQMRDGIDAILELKNGDYAFCAGSLFGERLIVRVDKNLKIIWTAKLSDSSTNISTTKDLQKYNRMIELADGKIVVIGNYVTCLESDGSLVFNQQYSTAGKSQIPVSVNGIATADGNIILSIKVYKNANILDNVLYERIMKIDKNNGEIIWRKDFARGTVNDYYTTEILTDNEENYYFLQETPNKPPNLLKLDKLGNLIWNKIFFTDAKSYTNVSMTKNKNGTIMLAFGFIGKAYLLNISNDGSIVAQYEEPLKYTRDINVKYASDNTLFVMHRINTRCFQTLFKINRQEIAIKRRPSSGKSFCSVVSNLKATDEPFLQVVNGLPFQYNPSILKHSFSNQLIIKDFKLNNIKLKTECPDTFSYVSCKNNPIKFNNITYDKPGIFFISYLDGTCFIDFYAKIKVVDFNIKQIDTTICEGQKIEIASKFFQKEGIYEEKMKNYGGCDSIIKLNLKIKNANLELIDSLSIEEGQSVKITPVSTSSDAEWKWSPPDFLSCSDCFSTIANPSEPTTYTLNGSYKNGCAIAKNVWINVLKKAKIFIPNIFTPNDDGVNDTFKVFANNGLETILDFSIYDRWGNEIYNEKNINPESIENGWDGTFKGIKANKGVYVYKIKVKFANQKEEILKGDFYLE